MHRPVRRSVLCFRSRGIPPSRPARAPSPREEYTRDLELNVRQLLGLIQETCGSTNVGQLMRLISETYGGSRVYNSRRKIYAFKLFVSGKLPGHSRF
ncbi:hypothetical protein ACP70R_028685 [Stipagrostis hirtigluma subsp. patula]